MGLGFVARIEDDWIVCEICLYFWRIGSVNPETLLCNNGGCVAHINNYREEKTKLINQIKEVNNE